MDELEIDGKKYLSSRRAAKEHKYHIDYIGQLIRGGKVVGKKVGRSWYVEQGSLKSYLTQEAGGKVPEINTPVAEDEVKIPEPISESVREVSTPIISRTEVIEEKIIQPTVPPVMPAQEKISEEAVSTRKVYFSTPEKEQAHSNTLTYVADDEPMLPVLNGRMRANADFVVPVRRVEEVAYDDEQEEETVEEIIEEMPRTSIRSKMPRATVLVGIIGLLALAAAISSTFLVTSIKVQEGQPASVGITIK